MRHDKKQSMSNLSFSVRGALMAAMVMGVLNAGAAHDVAPNGVPLMSVVEKLNVDYEDGLKAARIVQQNCHQYLRTEFYLNGYRVAAILRPKACELSPEAFKLLRNGKNTLAVYITSCRGHLHDFDFGIHVAKE